MLLNASTLPALPVETWYRWGPWILARDTDDDGKYFYAWTADHSDAEGGPNFFSLQLNNNSNGWYIIMEAGERKIVYSPNDDEDALDPFLRPLLWHGEAPGLVQLVRTHDLPAVLARLCDGLDVGDFGGVRPAEVTPGGFWLMTDTARVGLSASGLIIREGTSMPPAPRDFKAVP